MTSDPICLRVKGPFACFTRPEFHVERVSYPVITPSAPAQTPVGMAVPAVHCG